MTRLFTLFMLALISCTSSVDNQSEFTQQSTIDSLRALPWTLGQMEKNLWDYCLETEKGLRDENYLQEEDEIIDFIQYCIDNKLFPQPIIWTEIEGTTEPQYVDYKTYRKYRMENPIDTNRHFIVTSRYTIPTLSDTAINELRRLISPDTIN